MDNLRLFEGLLVAKGIRTTLLDLLDPYHSRSAIHLRSCFVYAWVVEVFTNQKVETCNWCLNMAIHEQDWHVFLSLLNCALPAS